LFRSLSSPEDDRLLRRLVLLRPPLLRFLLRLPRFLGLRLPDLLLLEELSESSELDSSEELELPGLELEGDLLVLILFVGAEDSLDESLRRIDLVF
jgi:hypothetical protein